jgi:hypothetical protein
MSNDRDQPTAPQSEAVPAGEPVALDQVGSEEATKLPGEDIAIELPIEAGDFNAQPQ